MMPMTARFILTLNLTVPFRLRSLFAVQEEMSNAFYLPRRISAASY